uniref:RING-type domain-containing protein n=1 Tax=Globisporangium ultimum (strain ATCC 200006 / CBS 805.95 / DAOM BR144) TaxID=431595 RepID=K3W885_GLOUD
MSGSSKELPSGAAVDDVICQCIALDFLPTPVKPDKFSPVTVKKLTFTSSNVYVPQEIFGHDAKAAGGECVICLEGALAAVLLPCRHFCVCRVCLDEIDQCPICRTKFTTYVCYSETDNDSAATSTTELQVKVL